MQLSQLTNDRQNNYNLIRFIAALVVLINHCFPLTGREEPFGRMLGMTPGTWALDIFFISSGFLVAQSLLRRQNAADYLLSRVLRIYPALFFVMLFTVCVIGAALTTLPVSDYFSHPDTAIYFIKGTTLLSGIPMTLPGVFTDTPYKNAVNGSLWSIIYEVKMYLLLLLLWGLAKYKSFAWLGNTANSRLRTIVAVTVISAALLFLCRALADTEESHLNRFVLMFFSGTLALLMQTRIQLERRYFLLAVCCLLASAFTRQIWFTVVYTLTIGYILFYLAYIPGGKIRAFNNIGDYSYGIYIYAFPIQQSIVSLIPDISPFQLMLLTIAATLPCAMLSWHLLEKRVLKNKPAYSAGLRNAFQKLPFRLNKT